jgi:hypothetical protein
MNRKGMEFIKEALHFLFVQDGSAESVEIWASSFSIEIFHLMSKTYCISRLFVFFFSNHNFS